MPHPWRRVKRWYVEHTEQPSMNPCPEEGRVAIRRCATCGLTYNPHTMFAQCAQCSEPTELLCALPGTLDGGKAPTIEDSQRMREAIQQEQAHAARLEREAAERQAAIDAQLDDALVGALHRDLNAWPNADPADWGWMR